MSPEIQVASRGDMRGNVKRHTESHISNAPCKLIKRPYNFHIPNPRNLPCIMASATEDDFIYGYGIVPLLATPRSGWCLRLYEYHTPVAERHFPIAPASLEQSLDWWQTLTEFERNECMASCAGIEEAYSAHLVDVAYAEAETLACAWLAARNGS